jgi:hypothetical protein
MRGSAHGRGQEHPQEDKENIVEVADDMAEKGTRNRQPVRYTEESHIGEYEVFRCVGGRRMYRESRARGMTVGRM